MSQILILEEDRQQFERLKRAIELKGHKAWLATKPSEAFEFLTHYEVDLVISAVNLDNCDVFKFLCDLKNNPHLQKIPFVFHCAEAERSGRYANETVMAAGKALGIRKYILLPKFDEAKLWEQLQECLPERAIKSDSLGGPVKTYSLSHAFWTKERRLA